jgi:glyoxylase-like metal-dependent hydrolase (beta-lactamase superfamily II)
MDLRARSVVAEGVYRMGEVSLRLVPDYPLFMDGGMMFGVIPKTLWIKHKVPDERNRIPVAANCLLVQGPQGTSLVEGGIGERFTDKEKSNFGLDDLGLLKKSLKSSGVEPEDVDHVFLTHLHFDHCGAVTTYDGSRLVPTFTRARHFVQRREYEILKSPDPRSKPSYRVEDLQAVEDAGLLELVDGDTEPVPGFELRMAPGHTAGHQVVLLHSAGETAAFMGDLIPFTAHLKTTWVAATDLMPLESMSSKERILAEVREKDYLVILYHEHQTPVGRLGAEGFQPV